MFIYSFIYIIVYLIIIKFNIICKNILSKFYINLGNFIYFLFKYKYIYIYLIIIKLNIIFNMLKKY